MAMASIDSYRLLFWLTQVVNVCMFAILLWWVISYEGGLGWSPNYGPQFNWHIIALTVGLVNITALEVMLFRSVRWLTRVQVKQLHAVMGVVVLILVIFGYWAVLEPHIAQNRINFSTLHSWVGTTTVVLYLLQVVIGSLTYLWPGFSLNFRSPYTPLHVFFGLAIFVLGTVTALLGLFEMIRRLKAFSGVSVMTNLCGVLMVVLAVLVVYIQTRPEYKREALVKSSKSRNPA